MRLGLRERFVAVLVVVSALTLAVAAVALLSPLDRLLRTTARADRSRRPVRSELGDFTRLPLRGRPARQPAAARRDARRCAAPAPTSRCSTARGRVLVTTDPDRSESLPGGARGAADRPRARGRSPAAARRPRSESRCRSASTTSAPSSTARQLARRRPGRDARRAPRVRSSRPPPASSAPSRRRCSSPGAWPGGSGACATPPSASRRSGRSPSSGPSSGRDEIGDLSRTFATMQTRLREQEQARRAFVATASHELRTPLTSLQVMLDLLIADLEADPIAARRRARAGPPRRRAGGAPLAARRRPARPQPHRRRAPAARRAGRARRGAAVGRRRVGGRGCARAAAAVAVADGEDAAWAIGDPGSVAQILRILLDNALRHTPRPATCASRSPSRRRHGRASRSRTTGPGVAGRGPRAHLRALRRAAPQRRAPAGSASGLAIARELARRMDGDLALEDTAGGARFVLSLPRAGPQ